MSTMACHKIWKTRKQIHFEFKVIKPDKNQYVHKASTPLQIDTWMSHGYICLWKRSIEICWGFVNFILILAQYSYFLLITSVYAQFSWFDMCNRVLAWFKWRRCCLVFCNVTPVYAANNTTVPPTTNGPSMWNISASACFFFVVIWARFPWWPGILRVCHLTRNDEYTGNENLPMWKCFVKFFLLKSKTSFNTKTHLGTKVVYQQFVTRKDHMSLQPIADSSGNLCANKATIPNALHYFHQNLYKKCTVDPISLNFFLSIKNEATGLVRQRANFSDHVTRAPPSDRANRTREITWSSLIRRWILLVMLEDCRIEISRSQQRDTCPRIRGNWLRNFNAQKRNKNWS